MDEWRETAEGRWNDGAADSLIALPFHRVHARTRTRVCIRSPFAPLVPWKLGAHVASCFDDIKGILPKSNISYREEPRTTYSSPYLPSLSPPTLSHLPSCFHPLPFSLFLYLSLTYILLDLLYSHFRVSSWKPMRWIRTHGPRLLAEQEMARDASKRRNQRGREDGRAKWKTKTATGGHWNQLHSRPLELRTVVKIYCRNPVLMHCTAAARATPRRTVMDVPRCGAVRNRLSMWLSHGHCSVKVFVNVDGARRTHRKRWRETVLPASRARRDEKLRCVPVGIYYSRCSSSSTKSGGVMQQCYLPPRLMRGRDRETESAAPQLQRRQGHECSPNRDGDSRTKKERRASVYASR